MNSKLLFKNGNNSTGIGMGVGHFHNRQKSMQSNSNFTHARQQSLLNDQKFNEISSSQYKDSIVTSSKQDATPSIQLEEMTFTQNVKSEYECYQMPC